MHTERDALVYSLRATRYSLLVTRYQLPARHAVVAQRAGGSPFVKLRENSWFLNFSLAILHLPLIIRHSLS